MDKVDYYNQESFWNKDFTTINRDKIRLDQIISMIPSDVGSILDVGCGNGYILNHIAKLNKYERLVGADFSETALKYLETEKHLASVTDLPFKDGSFDLVMCNEVLEHLPQYEFQQALKNLQRISKKYIIITVPNDEHLEDDLVFCQGCYTWYNQEYHMRSFNKDSIKRLFSDFNSKELVECGPKVTRIIHSPLSRLYNVYLFKKKPAGYAVCPTCGQKGDVSKKMNLSFINRAMGKFTRTFFSKQKQIHTDLIGVWSRK